MRAVTVRACVTAPGPRTQELVCKRKLANAQICTRKKISRISDYTHPRCHAIPPFLVVCCFIQWEAPSTGDFCLFRGHSAFLVLSATNAAICPFLSISPPPVRRLSSLWAPRCASRARASKLLELLSFHPSRAVCEPACTDSGSLWDCPLARKQRGTCPLI